MVALGQTSPERAEQIYLDTQPCRPLGAPRRAPGADTSHLPRNTRWHQTDRSARPCTLSDLGGSLVTKVVLS